MIDLGDTVPLAVTIVDEAGAPTAAATVTLTITRPDGALVPGTDPSMPTPGRYVYDFVPAAAGIYLVRWASTGPATAFVDVVDVRAAAGTVVSLADAKLYLNKNGATSVDDDELRPMMAAAVDRVDRHLWTQAERDAGRTLLAEPAVTESQVLAVKVVLAEMWRTHRSRLNRTGAGVSGTAVDADTGPAGVASLTSRLTELLGLPAEGPGSRPPAPTGSFPEPRCWPDPVEVW